MGKKKQSTAETRKKALKATESSRNHKRGQEQSQDFADPAHSERVQMEQRLTKTTSEMHAVSIYFLNTEADTGLTLARIAMDSHDAEKRARNRRHAREAYNCLVKYHHTAAHASNEALEALHEKIEKLREMLESLGEHL